MRRMLLVEDNSTDEKLTLRAFKKHGVATQIDVARDGEEALAFLFDVANPLPAVVLMDLKLPKIDGLEVLQRLRAHHRTRLVPVVVLTASKEQELFWLLTNEEVPVP
jgi:two-component system response regulator